MRRGTRRLLRCQTCECTDPTVCGTCILYVQNIINAAELRARLQSDRTVWPESSSRRVVGCARTVERSACKKSWLPVHTSSVLIACAWTSYCRSTESLASRDTAAGHHTVPSYTSYNLVTQDAVISAEYCVHSTRRPAYTPVHMVHMCPVYYTAAPAAFLVLCHLCGAEYACRPFAAPSWCKLRCVSHACSCRFCGRECGSAGVGGYRDAVGEERHHSTKQGERERRSVHTNAQCLTNDMGE